MRRHVVRATLILAAVAVAGCGSSGPTPEVRDWCLGNPRAVVVGTMVFYPLEGMTSDQIWELAQLGLANPDGFNRIWMSSERESWNEACQSAFDLH